MAKNRAAGAGRAAGAPETDRVLDGNMGYKPTLRQARVRKLMSMNELGKRAGVAASTVLKIEQGAAPRLATIGKLAAALEVEADAIAWPGDPLGSGDAPDSSTGSR